MSPSTESDPLAGSTAVTPSLLAGKVVLVTGASAGIGAGLCASLAGLGARVAGMARRFSSDRIDSLENGKVTEIRGDVTDPADCERVVAETIRAAGRIDVLINNAGSMGANPIATIVDTTLDDFNAMFDVNVRGPFLMTRAVLPHMAAQGDGLIINLSSFAAVIAVGHMALYGASKAALMQLSNTIAVEWGQHGIRSVSIVLGGVDTQMTEGTARGMYRLVHGPDAVYVPPEHSANMLSLDDLGLAMGALCSPLMKAVSGAAIAMDSNVSAGSLSSMFIHMGPRMARVR
jgi:NAD(P)-dependent dehydrogenase (short-subunit alcohol dehydrogenase family)